VDTGASNNGPDSDPDKLRIKETPESGGSRLKVYFDNLSLIGSCIPERNYLMIQAARLEEIHTSQSTPTAVHSERIL
jgi:hypothetical protein